MAQGKPWMVITRCWTVETDRRMYLPIAFISHRVSLLRSFSCIAVISALIVSLFTLISFPLLCLILNYVMW